MSILLTGASGFLGYHVAKVLNQANIRPRVLELRDGHPDVLERLNVERCPGTLEDAAAVQAACAGVHTVIHLAFKVGVGGGAALHEEMERINVGCTNQLLTAAAASGVKRAVVASSALAVGVNRNPQPLDESADWSKHAFDLHYALVRRRAEAEALKHASPNLAIMAVCPAFTFGPDDPVGAPANKLVQAMMTRKLRFTIPVGCGALDVRDFAAGVVLAAERGRSGERYLLSGENVLMTDLLAEAAGIAGVPAPRVVAPTPLLSVAIGGLELVSRIRGKSAPVTREVLQVIGRYAWYDTTKARTELGWSSRPLRETLTDTIQWLRSHPSSRSDPSVRERSAVVI
jgi:dihydroflavonol-4-reductase